MGDMRYPENALAQCGKPDRGVETGQVRVLAVGDLAPESLPEGDDIVLFRARIESVEPDCLSVWKPDLVLSPLVGLRFDCFDIAERLARAGFTGRYRAVVSTLPDPTVVRREIAAHFPGLDFDVLVLRPAGPAQ